MTSRLALAGSIWILFSILAPAQSAEDFEKGVDSIHRLMKRKKWKSALDDMQALLTANSQEPYVYESANEIIEDLKTCLFYCNYPEPEFQDLIDGKLVKYRESSGDIKIEYSESMRDFERSDKLYFHPATFTGPYTITLKGKSYPKFTHADASPYLLVASSSESAVSVLLGQPLEMKSSTSTRWMPARMSKWDSETKSWSLADEKETPPCRIGKPFTIQVKVSRTSVSVSYNGGRYLSTSLPKGGYGGFGIQRFDFDELTMEGKVETSWLAGLMDAAMQSKYAEFEKSGLLAQSVPNWLLMRPVTKSTGGERGRLWPAELTAIQKNYYELLMDLLDEDRIDEVEVRIAPNAKPQLPASARLYVTASLKQAKGDYPGALADLQESRKLDPKYYWAAWRLADVHFDAKNKEEGEKAVETLMKEFPGRVLGYDILCFQMMRAGLLEESRKMVTTGLAVSPLNRNLKEVDNLLVKAEKGPRWRETYEYKSRHYHVMTDIDKKTCQEAAEQLEQAYLAFSVYVRGEKAEAADRFRVYIFSGESGYLAYAKDVLGTAPTSSAGLYSPYLKQLLIWNLPERSDMFRTVQHEGFHQYVDQILPDLPVWLNEGLAEYFEIAGSGTWTKGVINDRHVEILKRQGLMPLKAFIHGNASDFYSNAGLCYPQAWCLVHFLRHSTRENAEIYKNLIEALIETRSNERSLEKIFGTMDFTALEKDLKAHLASLK